MQSWLKSLEPNGYDPIRGEICPEVRKDNGGQLQRAAIVQSEEFWIYIKGAKIIMVIKQNTREKMSLVNVEKVAVNVRA